MQRYDEKQLIPRNKPDYCRSCCDRLGVLRQSRGIRLNCVVQSISGMNMGKRDLGDRSLIFKKNQRPVPPIVRTADYLGI